MVVIFIKCLQSLFKKSKTEGKDQGLIQSSTTPDPGYHMGKSTRIYSHRLALNYSVLSRSCSISSLYWRTQEGCGHQKIRKKLNIS